MTTYFHKFERLLLALALTAVTPAAALAADGLFKSRFSGSSILQSSPVVQSSSLGSAAVSSPAASAPSAAPLRSGPKVGRLFQSGAFNGATNLQSQAAPGPSLLRRRIMQAPQASQLPAGQLNSDSGLLQSSRTSSFRQRLMQTPPQAGSSLSLPATNGNTGITGAGLPGGSLSQLRARTRVANAGQPAVPQQVRSFGLPDIGGAFEDAVDAAGGAIGDGLDSLGIGPGKNAPPIPPPSNSGGFEGTIEAKADLPGSAVKPSPADKYVPGAGKLRTPGASVESKIGDLPILDKYTPSPSIPTPSIPIPSDPAPGGGGGGAGGGGTGGGAPNMPAPAPTPAPAPSPGGKGGGFPWQDVIVGTAVGLANRPIVYQTPVYVPAPQPVVQQVVAPAAPARAALADLIVEDIELVAPATKLVGPAYRVSFRNQGLAATPDFRVALVAAMDARPNASSPMAVIDVAPLASGQVSEVTLRLPRTAMRLVSAGGEASAFTHLFVAVDFDNVVAESDKDNNSALIERSLLESQQ